MPCVHDLDPFIASMWAQELELDDCAKIWFVRFALDRECRTLACGTKSGMVLVYDPLTLCRRPIAKLKRGPSVLKAVAPIVRLLTCFECQHKIIGNASVPMLLCRGT